MYLVYAKDIQLSAGKRIMLSHVTFTINEHEKIGIVGKNGVGKSTLLKTLAAKSQPKKGEIDVRATTWYVPQDVTISDEEKLLPVISYVMLKYDEAWNIFHLIEELFGYKNITAEKLMGHLSGGELTMLHLCLGFMIEPQLLLLDEPTNHLDIFGTKNLIEKLKKYTKTVVIVSHDSFLLNEISEKILEIKEQKLNKYSGNYDSFMEQKQHMVAVIQRKVRDMTKEIKGTQKWKQEVSERIMRTEVERKRAQAAGVPKLISGFFADNAGKSTTHSMAQAKTEEREQKAKLKEYQGQLKKTQSLNIELGNSEKSVFSLVDISHGKLSLVSPITEKEIVLVKDLTFRITNEDKAIVTGRNGSGKSSLMKAIQKQEGYLLSSKNSVNLPSESLYIDQHYSLIKPNKTLITHISECAPGMEYEDIRKILGNYLFIREDQINQDATTLSGGEKARLALAMASVSPRTLLLLDEPTNNLDNESVEELVFALNNYVGGILLISHDIGFIKKLNLTQEISL